MVVSRTTAFVVLAGLVLAASVQLTRELAFRTDALSAGLAPAIEEWQRTAPRVPRQDLGFESGAGLELIELYQCMCSAGVGDGPGTAIAWVFFSGMPLALVAWLVRRESRWAPALSPVAIERLQWLQASNLLLSTPLTLVTVANDPSALFNPIWAVSAGNVAAGLPAVLWWMALSREAARHHASHGFPLGLEPQRIAALTLHAGPAR